MAHMYARQSNVLGSSKQRHILRPVILAYLLGLLSTTSPRLLQIAAAVFRGKSTFSEGVSKIRELVRQQLRPDQFATSCALLIAGVTALPKVIIHFLYRNGRLPVQTISISSLVQLVTLCTSLTTAALSFSLLNYKDSKIIHFITSSKNVRSDGTPLLAGQTLGLTFFGAVRALDIVISAIWRRQRATGQDNKVRAQLKDFVEDSAAPVLFAASSAIVMWAWFHSPYRLPRSYQKWISSAAQIDERLVEALRQCRFGNFVYGKDTGMGPLLESLSTELGYPKVWGDPSKTIPVPCELYHSGTGPNCEYHAAIRFIRAWSFAMRMYVPLNMAMLLRKGRAKRDPFRALLEAARSSTFLGAFVALFYYGVCLARTRIGPRIFSRDTVTPMMWDGGLCVGTGCLTCGWSILLEKPVRREEIAFFVAPRALCTIFPRRYPRKHIWIEQCVFTLSAAVILTTASQAPSRVRGVFGSLLKQIVES